MKKIISLLVFCLVFYGVTALANEEAYDVDQVLEKIYQSVFESQGLVPKLQFRTFKTIEKTYR